MNGSNEARSRPGDGDREQVPAPSSGSWENRLAVLRTRASYYCAQRNAGLQTIDIALMDMIMMGQLEGRPVDMSALAGIAQIPRPTVRRYVNRLSSEGWLAQKRQGRHRYLYLTDRALDTFGKNLDRYTPLARARKSESQR